MLLPEDLSNEANCTLWDSDKVTISDEGKTNFFLSDTFLRYLKV